MRDLNIKKKINGRINIACATIMKRNDKYSFLKFCETSFANKKNIRVNAKKIVQHEIYEYPIKVTQLAIALKNKNNEIAYIP